MTESKAKRVKRKEAETVETVPDAWDRFESAVKKVAPVKGQSRANKKPAPDRNSNKAG